MWRVLDWEQVLGQGSDSEPVRVLELVPVLVLVLVQHKPPGQILGKC